MGFSLNHLPAKKAEHPQGDSPHTAPVSGGGQCSGREVSCQLPAPAQLLCRNPLVVSQPDPQDKRKFVCSCSPQGNQHMPTKRPSPETKLGIQSLSTREMKQNPQNCKAPAEPDKHLQVQTPLPSLDSLLTSYMGHKVRNVDIQPQSSISFGAQRVFSLFFGWRVSIHPSCSSAGTERGSVFTLTGVLFMQTFLNCYYTLFCSSKRRAKPIERLLPMQAANTQLVPTVLLTGGALAEQHGIHLLQEALIKILPLFEKKQRRKILGNINLICDTEKPALKVLRT